MLHLALSTEVLLNAPRQQVKNHRNRHQRNRHCHDQVPHPRPVRRRALIQQLALRILYLVHEKTALAGQYVSDSLLQQQCPDLQTSLAPPLQISRQRLPALLEKQMKLFDALQIHGIACAQLLGLGNVPVHRLVRGEFLLYIGLVLRQQKSTDSGRRLIDGGVHRFHSYQQFVRVHDCAQIADVCGDRLIREHPNHDENGYREREECSGAPLHVPRFHVPQCPGVDGASPSCKFMSIPSQNRRSLGGLWKF